MPLSSIIRSDDLRNENRRRLLDTLRTEGPCPPARLCDLTGLSAASISTLSSQMVEQGILMSRRYRIDGQQSLRGRPRSQLSLNPDAGHAVTISVTIDRIRARLIDYAGTVRDVRQDKLQTRALSEPALLDHLCRCVRSLCDGAADSTLRHIGVAFQGVTEHATGTVLWSPIIQHRNVPLRAELQRRFRIEVSINNDCHLISRALSRSHAEQLGDTFATVLFSHGVGLGLHLNGQPFAGTRSSALEIGHLRFQVDGALCRCGKRGCIEAYAADYGIVRLAQNQAIGDPPAGRVSDETMRSLIRCALAGQRSAIQAFRMAGAAVGEGLANLFTLLDPMPVALVGRSDDAFELMREGLHARLESHLDPGHPTGELSGSTTVASADLPFDLFSSCSGDTPADRSIDHSADHSIDHPPDRCADHPPDSPFTRPADSTAGHPADHRPGKSTQQRTDKLLHCFGSDEPLLELGLAADSLSRVDHLFADRSVELRVTT